MRYFGVFFLKRLVNEYAIDVPIIKINLQNSRLQSKRRYQIYLSVCLMVFNATFNNISFISWPSVLLVEETGGPGENH
jgi:hypothetical protein